MRSRRITVLIAALGLVMSPWLLSGCGGASEEAAEQAIEEGTGGDVELDDDKVTFEDEEGNTFEYGAGAELPDSWPEEVPPFDGGELTNSLSTPDGASASWTVEGSAADAVDAYDGQLTDAGFTLGAKADLGSSTFTRTYSSETHEVTVTATETDGTATLTVIAAAAP